MNKISHRREPSYQISKIQANLKQMKEEVDDYLKKHSKEKVPPILRARHYLLVDTINNLGTTRSIESPQKLMKDLSSEALASFSQRDKIQQVSQLIHERRGRNRVIKQKRGSSMTNSYQHCQQPQVSCLLPNICNLKLYNGESLSSSITGKRPQPFQKGFHSTIINQFPQNPQFSDKKYQSIDLNQSLLLSLLSEQNKTAPKRDQRQWPRRSLSKRDSKKSTLNNSMVMNPTVKDKGSNDDIGYQIPKDEQEQELNEQQIDLETSSRSYNRDNIRNRRKLHSQFMKQTSMKLTVSHNFSGTHKPIKRHPKKQKLQLYPKNEPYTFEPWQDEYTAKEQTFYAFDNSLC